LFTNKCDIVLLDATNITDLNTRTNKLDTFVQNSLGENECGKICMKIKQRERHRGIDFDLHIFLFFGDYKITYSFLKCNAHVQGKTAEESTIENTLKEDRLCIRCKYRHGNFRTDWKIDIKLKVVFDDRKSSY